MKLTAEEFIDEVNGHNSWQHYPPSKQKVIGWLKQFAEMQVEAINYSRCCESDSELLNHDDLEVGEQVRITQTKLVEINYFREDGDIDVEDTTSVFTVSLNEISKVV